MNSSKTNENCGELVGDFDEFMALLARLKKTLPTLSPELKDRLRRILDLPGEAGTLETETTGRTVKVTLRPSHSLLEIAAAAGALDV